MCIAPANQRRTDGTDLLRAMRAPSADPPEGQGRAPRGGARRRPTGEGEDGQIIPDLRGKIPLCGANVLYDGGSQYTIRTGTVFGTLHDECSPDRIRQTARSGVTVFELPQALCIEITRHHFHPLSSNIRAL